MFIDLVHTPKEWLLKHSGHKVKQYYIEKYNETKIMMECGDCNSLKEIDKVVHNKNDFESFGQDKRKKK